jgi:hypothetical protein
LLAVAAVTLHCNGNIISGEKGIDKRGTAATAAAGSASES